MPVLAVVERAYRGRVEQQYAHVLWLLEGLTGQHRTDVLLRGVAAGYAVLGAGAVPLRLGVGPPTSEPDYALTIDRLAGAGARVMVSSSSLSAVGLAGRALHAAVEPVEDARLAAIFALYDRLWYL